MNAFQVDHPFPATMPPSARGESRPERSRWRHTLPPRDRRAGTLFRFRSSFEILRAQPLFAGVSDGELLKFTALGQERRVERDHPLMPATGRLHHPLALILEGEAVLACGQGMEELFLRALEPGDLVGEVDAFSSLPASRTEALVRETAPPYHAPCRKHGGTHESTRFATTGEPEATARTLTVVRLIEWDHDAMREALRRWPDVALGLLGGMARRQRDMQRRVAGLCGHKAPRRLARAVSALLEERGLPHRDEAGGSGVLLPRTPSRTRLAEIAGMARETASRLLNEWSRRGWVDAWQGDLVVRDLRQLRRLAGQG